MNQQISRGKLATEEIEEWTSGNGLINGVILKARTLAMQRGLQI